MHPISLLIKPVSGNCNLHCSYCFYHNIIEQRASAKPNIMSEATLEILIKKTFEFAEGNCSIAFQGGEPTLAGIDFFQKAVDFVKRYNTRNINVQFSFQTNGILIDEKWANFLKANNFLVGVSLDGNAAVHNRVRRDCNGKESHKTVLNATKILSKKQVPFNILSVVTNNTAENTKLIYEFFKNYHFKYLQFIPCLPDFGSKTYPLTAPLYAKFLIELFALWYEDLLNNRYISIRNFDNYLSILTGKAPEACDMTGICSIQYVAETDGSIYPCDFFTLDSYCLGNINDLTYQQIDEARNKIKFIEESSVLNEKCKKCNYFALCRGGCKRHRIIELDRKQIEPSMGTLPSDYFCNSYTLFFDSCLSRMQNIVRSMQLGR